MVALTFPLLSMGEETKAGGAEKEECMGKSLLVSMSSVRVRANGYHSIQLILARPLNSQVLPDVSEALDFSVFLGRVDLGAL